MSGQPSTARLHREYLIIAEAWHCAAQEEDDSKLPVSAAGVETKMKPFEVITLRLVTNPRIQRATHGESAGTY